MGNKLIGFLAALVAGAVILVAFWPSSHRARLPVRKLRQPSQPAKRANVLPIFAKWALGKRGNLAWFQRARAAKTAAALPETIDVVAAVLGAGGTPMQALELLAQRGPEIVKSPTLKVLARRGAGAGLAESFELMVTELGNDYRPTIRALVATERDGAPVATLMERLASEARSARRARSEARTRRLPVLLMGPLVLCFLPAVVIGAIIPLLMVSLSDLSF